MLGIVYFLHYVSQMFLSNSPIGKINKDAIVYIRFM